MRDEACAFWELDRNKYTLVLPNMHNIMTLNSDPSHQAHTLAKYFEIHRAKRAILHLVKPDRTRQSVYAEEKSSLILKGSKKTSRFEGGDKRPFHEIVEEVKRKNLRMFFDKYPDLKELQIKDMEQFNRTAKGRLNIKNPDKTFCAFLLSFSMLLLSIFTFYSH
jgi:hypothetical protein